MENYIGLNPLRFQKVDICLFIMIAQSYQVTGLLACRRADAFMTG
jgi:hypothetical protein